MESRIEFESRPAAPGGFVERLRAWHLRHQLLVVLLALAATGAALERPALPVWFLGSLPAGLVLLAWFFWAVEPALVVGVSAGAGVLWAARVHALVPGPLDPRWVQLGVLAGGALATFRVQARLERFRGRSERVPAALAGSAALVSGLLALALLQEGLAASAAVWLPTVSAALLAPIGMNILFLRGHESGAPRLLHLLGGLLVFGFLAVLQVLLFLGVDPLLRLRDASAERRLARLRDLAQRGMRQLFVRFPYGRVEFLGLGPDTFRVPSIVVSNHQSSVDIPLVLSLSPDLRLSLKQRVWDAPYLGIGARRLGHVLVDPERPETTLERLRAALAAGASVHVFPEGTRGNDVYPRRFHRGAFDLAAQLGCAVVPVVLCDTRTCVPRGAYWVERFHMTVKVLPPVTLASLGHGAGARELQKHVQELVRSELVRELDRLNTPAVLRGKVRRLYRYLGRGVERRAARELADGSLEGLAETALPRRGTLLDLGCGLGVRASWLRERHPELRIHGFDACEPDVRVARLAGAGSERASFTAGSPEDWPLSEADAAVLSGASAGDAALLARLAGVLPPGAPLVVLRPSPAAAEACRGAGFLPTERARVYVRGPRA